MRDPASAAEVRSALLTRILTPPAPRYSEPAPHPNVLTETASSCQPRLRRPYGAAWIQNCPKISAKPVSSQNSYNSLHHSHITPFEALTRERIIRIGTKNEKPRPQSRVSCLKPQSGPELLMMEYFARKSRRINILQPHALSNLLIPGILPPKYQFKKSPAPQPTAPACASIPMERNPQSPGHPSRGRRGSGRWLHS
jgi:hypothetical protein